MPYRKPTEKVAEQLKKIPTSPGCYIYKGEEGQILYVGKAINLRSRVRSYFRKSANHSVRIDRLVHKIRDIEIIVVENELEALVLECNLIKEHRPPYNVRMRDDKSYPFILVTKEKYPRVLFRRNASKRHGKTFGPYTSAYAVRETLTLLHKAFPLIPCGKSWPGTDDRKPCLYFHLGQCLAPCAGLAKKDEYEAVINQVVRFLEGKEEGVIQEFEKKMEQASENLEFERAAQLRDQINALKSVLERQKVLSTDEQDRDIVAVVKDERGAAVQMMYIRGGRLIGQHNYLLDGSKEASPTEAVQEFVKQYYTSAPEIPREVLLPVEIEEKQIVESWLRQKKGAAVTVEVPQGGEGLRLVDLAAQNAEFALKSFAEEMAHKAEWAEKSVEQLSEAIGLPTPAKKIEGYDISNIQGKAPVGSMVVTVDGEANKSLYRRFRIKWHAETPDDFAMMHEVITRRLRKFLDGDSKFSPLPDLIMIDGGKGQLHAAIQARDELDLTVPMVGLAKRQEIIFVPHEDRQKWSEDDSLAIAPEWLEKDEPIKSQKVKKEYTWDEIILPLDSPGLILLRRLRDEAHRFALTYHRKVRDKRLHGSLLDEIPGVGPKRRRMLLRTFGSVEGIRRATAEEIAAVPTLTLRQAREIKDYLQGE